MWTLISLVVLTPLVLGVWAIEAIVRALRPKTAMNLSREVVKALAPWEKYEVRQLTRGVETFNEYSVERMGRRWGCSKRTGAGRARMLELEYRADAVARRHARALDEYRAVLVECGYNLSGVPSLMSDSEAEDAALLEEAEREVEQVLAS